MPFGHCFYFQTDYLSPKADARGHNRESRIFSSTCSDQRHASPPRICANAKTNNQIHELLISLACFCSNDEQHINDTKKYSTTPTHPLTSPPLLTCFIRNGSRCICSQGRCLYTLCHVVYGPQAPLPIVFIYG